MSTTKFLSFRGNLKSIAGHQSQLSFVVTHPEDQPTSVYRLNCETLKLDEVSLTSGAVTMSRSPSLTSSSSVKGSIIAVSIA